jgi:hypothetical protein
MAHYSVSDFTLLINHQILAQELISDHLRQLQALLKIVVSISNVLYLEKSTIHSYLCVVDDIINQAKDFQEHQLNYLFRIAKTIDKPKSPPGDETLH